MEKNEPQSLLHTVHKANLKQIIDLNVNVETRNYFEQTIG